MQLLLLFEGLTLRYPRCFVGSASDRTLNCRRGRRQRNAEIYRFTCNGKRSDPGEVVGAQLHNNAILGEDSDVVLAHFLRCELAPCVR